MKNNNIRHYIRIREKLYNANIKNLLDTNQMDIELFNSLTNINLLSDENKIKIAMLFSNQNTELAEKIINEVEDDKFPEEINIVKCAIKSQNKYDKLTDAQKVAYNEAIEYGRYALSIGELEEAYDIFSMGLYITKHPIFDYYIAKSLYKKGHYNDAEKYFLAYKNYGGGEKTTKMMLYLGVMAEKKGDYANAKYIYDSANHIEEILGNSNHYVIKYNMSVNYCNIKK